MRVLVNKLLKNALLSQFVANFIGFIANFNLFKIFFTKNIANMHREHDVSAFFKHRQKHQVQWVFFTPPKNRIVKNCPCPFLKYISEKFSVRIDNIYFDRGIVLFWLDTKVNSYICNFLFLCLYKTTPIAGASELKRVNVYVKKKTNHGFNTFDDICLSSFERIFLVI